MNGYHFTLSGLTIKVQFSKSGLLISLRRTATASLLRQLGRWQQENSRAPVYRQLADALRLLILDGRLPLDSRLPGEREFAAALDVSRTTVASALGVLRDEGYLTSRHGSGSVTQLPASRERIPTRTGGTPLLDLSTAALSAGPEIHHAYQQALIALPPHLASTGYDPQGIAPLRTAIAQRYQARGLPTTPEQIMVVNGAVSGFALVLRLLTGPGDRVVVARHRRHSGRIMPSGARRAAANGLGYRRACRHYRPDLAASGLPVARFS